MHWNELIAELPVGVVLHDGAATVDVNSSATKLLGCDLRRPDRPAGWQLRDDTGAPVPELSEFAAQLRHTESAITLPLVVTCDAVPSRRLWADLRTVEHRGRPMLLVVIRPVHTDVLHGSGLLDPTTGLPQRALLLDRLGQSLARARTHGTRSTLVLANVRGLAEVNARFGFACGDDLLGLLARRLRAGLPEDQTVARYAGGTFAVLADHADGTGAHLAERIRGLAATRTAVGDGHVRPRLRTSWVTSDGSDQVHEVLAAAERIL